MNTRVEIPAPPSLDPQPALPALPALPDQHGTPVGDGAPARSHEEPLPPLPYHRLMRQTPASSRWWRPLAVLGVAVGLYIAMLIPALVLWIVGEAGTLGTALMPTPDLLDPTNPMDILLGLGLIALMLPAALLATRWAGRAPGILHSVRGRLRWGLLGRTTAIVLPIFAVVHGLGFVLDPPEDVRTPELGTSLLMVYLIVVALTPLQCAAEEYVFRGVPMQVFGTWLRSPLWGILVPVPFFVLGHGYDWVGQIDLAVFAICMGLLAWKSGGLEIPIVIHTANNLTLFLLAPFSPSSLEQGAVDPVALLLSLPLTLGLTAGLWVWVSRRHGVRFLEPVTRRDQPRADRA